MSITLQLLASLSATLGMYGVYKLVGFYYNQRTSPLQLLPGPPSPSFIYGNMREIWNAENWDLHEKWVEEYGTTMKYMSFVGTTRLFTTDLKALNHILMNNYTYQKPEAVRYILTRVLGAASGILVVEEDKHRQQRKIMNPAFGAAQIRELTEIFIEKSIELRDIWAAESTKQGGTGRIDVLPWLSKMTLDVIGLAGFNYKFDALTGNPNKNELNEAFSTVLHTRTRMSMIPLLRGSFPPLRFLRAEDDADANRASRAMARIGNQLLSESKNAILQGEKMEKTSWKSRDLLSILLRANMATDLPDDQRMADEDVLAQVPTFLMAGHETTSAATMWALYALTQAPEVQVKLRDELLAVSTDNPTMDELNALPHLDSVVRETLRVHSPVPTTFRVAVKDDMLPLSTPFMDKYGVEHDSIHVQKGQVLPIPILLMNRAKSIWGEDSFEFKPERWQSIPEAAASIPGVWGNMLTFLGGPRACIGFRFSLVEMKALLFTLVRAFEFELAVPAKDISKKMAVVQRPLLVSDPDAGDQMPLFVKPYNCSV